MTGPGAMAFPYGITVTVQHQDEDKFGNFVTSDEVQLPGCALNLTGSGRAGAATSREATFGAETVDRHAELYIPPGADIRPTDRLKMPDGSRWSVVGVAADAHNPLTGWTPGGVVQIELVTG